MGSLDDAAERTPPDWEAFYRDYREPGYVDGFEITSKLGGGVFGVVYRARRLSIGKDYAIKFLKVDDVDVRRAVLAELEQVRLFAQIDHPNLVAIEDRGEVDGIPFLVMAFAGDQTLRDLVPEGRPPSAEEKEPLLRAFTGAARGLQALHDRSLVHFDVKPANVFLKGGVARLGDYGLSRLVTHSRGSLSMGRGTPHYMAPEVLQRRGDVRSDVYSLGVMLYELLCGRVPFQGDSPWEVLRQHEESAPSMPAHLTEAERGVLTRCLAKDPDERFQDVASLLAALGAGDAIASPPPAAGSLRRCALPPPLPHERAPEGSPAAAAMPPLPEAAGRRGARRRGGSALFGFGGLAAAAVLVVAALYGGLQVVRAAPSEPYTERFAVRFDARHLEVDHLPELQRDDGPLERRVARVAFRALRAGRRAAERDLPLSLQPLDTECVAAPDDLSSYLLLLEPLAAAPRFVPRLAERCAQQGRGASLAAAAMLQELDYSDGLACRRAANLQSFLSFACGVDDLVVELAGYEPSARETCMFAAVADGWREVIERFAPDDDAYGRLLDACGGYGGAARR